MNDRKNRYLLVGLCLMLIFINACGPSQAELDATATQAAVAMFATQTAEAPTATLTPTNTPTPTSTPTDTPTITPTETPSMRAQDYLDIGLEHSRNGERDKAIEAYTKAIEIDPEFEDAWTNRGVQYAYLWEIDLAIENFNTALELNPESIKALINRGQAYLDAGLYNEAKEDFEKAKKIAVGDSNYSSMSHVGLGQAYTGLENYDLAIRNFSQAILVDDLNMIAYVLRGEAYLKNGNQLEAFEDLAYVFEFSDDEQAQKMAGDLLIGEIPAEYSVDEANAMADEHYNIAENYFNEEKYEDAIVELNQAIELYPLHADYFRARGISNEILGNLDEAVTDYSYVIALYSTFPYGYFLRASVYAQQSHIEQAVTDFEKAIELGLYPDDTAVAEQAVNELKPKLEYCSSNVIQPIQGEDNPSFSIELEGVEGELFVISIGPAFPSQDDLFRFRSSIFPKTEKLSTMIQYELKESDFLPIDLSITVFYPGCAIDTVVTWP